MAVWSLVFGFWIRFSIVMVYWMIKHRIMPVLAYKDNKEPWMQENGLNNSVKSYKIKSV